MLALTSLLIFGALRVIPGDPVSTLSGTSGGGLSEEQIANTREELGLDEPIPIQYVTWLGGVVTGDLGSSYFSGFSTTRLIEDRMWPTIELCVVALLVALLIAVPLGLLSGLRPHSLTDRLLTASASLGLAVPTFWLGVILIWLFSVRLQALPSRGYVGFAVDPVEHIRHILLPAATLGVVLAAPIMRFLRASLLDTLSAGFVRTAEGKGLLWHHVVLRHALPNALLPTLTFVGLLAGSMLGGVVVIESVFGWPGLGSLAVDAVSKRDYIVLQGVVLIAAAAFIVVSLVVDILSAAIDPRLRVGSS